MVSIRGDIREIKAIRNIETSHGTELVLVFKTGSSLRLQPTDEVQTSLHWRQLRR
ncbi:hypothetical protein [Streptomyces roseoverticillatus]|uniref:hypothetical protein n=1 Tax=Streptomyces roseoverticillatus TaxID=66429 RepID=UPI0012FE8A9F|nr:hypothetical protein [Streptomyces roseoverticillatus]